MPKLSSKKTAPLQAALSIRDLLDRAKAHIEAGESRMHQAAADVAAAHKLGATQCEIAAAVGKSQAWVCGLLKWRRSGWADTPFGPQVKAARAAHAIISQTNNHKADEPKEIAVESLAVESLKTGDVDVVGDEIHQKSVAAASAPAASPSLADSSADMPRTSAPDIDEAEYEYDEEGALVLGADDKLARDLIISLGVERAGKVANTIIDMLTMLSLNPNPSKLPSTLGKPESRKALLKAFAEAEAEPDMEGGSAGWELDDNGEWQRAELDEDGFIKMEQQESPARSRSHKRFSRSRRG